MYVTKMQADLGWDTLPKRRRDSRFCMMYKIDHYLVDVETEKYYRIATAEHAETTSSTKNETLRRPTELHFFPRTVIGARCVLCVCVGGGGGGGGEEGEGRG